MDSFGMEDLKRIHGRDERVSVADYIDSIGFYVQLLRNTSGPFDATQGDAGRT